MSEETELETPLAGPARLVEIPGSPWLAECRAWDHSEKIRAEHRHIVLRTYDDVIQVLCSEVRVLLGEPIPADPMDGDEDERPGWRPVRRRRGRGRS